MKASAAVAQIQLLLTERCNIACRHCSVPAEESPADHELGAELWSHVVEVAAGSGTTSLVVNGGEALLRPDALTLMEVALRAGMEWVSLITNGLLFTAPTSERIATAQRTHGSRFGIHVSIDGASAETHDWMRGDGTFDRLDTSLRRLLSAGGRIDGVNSVMHSGNRHEFGKLAQLASELGASSWTVFPAADLGRGRELRNRGLGSLDWSELVEESLAVQRRTGMRVSIGGPVMNDEWPESENYVPTPAVTRPDKVCLGPDGAAFTCPPLRTADCGRVGMGTDPVDWNDISLRARAILEHACPSCKYLLVCTGVNLSRPLRPRTGPFGTPRTATAVGVPSAREAIEGTRP